MEDEFSIGYWIKRRRKTLDMTQKELADRVGCALITVAKIEADQRKPSREIATLLAEHLNIPAAQRDTFVQVMRGQKSSAQLRRIPLGEHQPAPQQPSPPPISSPEAGKLRGLELIGKISRSRLVGRGAELALARAVWKQATTGESQVLVIHGEPGIGKSRLARELISEVKRMGGIALVGECFAEGGMPYAPLVRILQNQPDLPLELPTTVLADLKHIAPPLEAYLSDIPANPPLNSHAEKARLFESIHTYFQYFYQKDTLLLLIEDVHWADHGTISVLQSLAHRFRQANARVVMVLTTREVSPSGPPALNSLFDDLLRAHLSTTVHLERFDQDGTRELLAAIFTQEITDEFIQLMHRETQGNPFFIEEVCKDLIESQQIYWEKGRWERKNLTELRVPQNVRAAIQARLDKLGEETQELLQTAAVIGRRFEFDVLRHALPGEEADQIDRLEMASKAQIVQETGQATNGGVFVFSHVLIASVLREGMSAPRRRNVHKRIIVALEKIHPKNFGLLAYHCLEAEENGAAAGYFRKAGDHAMRAFAHEDAIRYYSEGLALTPLEDSETCHLLLARAKVYDLRGQRALQLSDLVSAEAKAELAQDLSLRAAVALARGEYSIQVTEQADVIEYTRRAIALSEQAGTPAIAAQAYMLWGRALSEMGELKESREHLLQAGKIAHETGLGLIEARSMINLGNVDYRLGDYSSAKEKYSLSLGTIRALGERRIECMLINNLGNVYWAQGDLEAALRSYEQSLEIARAIGDRLNEARGLSNIGSILTEQYHYPEALERLQQALLLLQELGQQADESILLGHMGDVMEALGSYDQAYEYKSKALTMSQEADDPQGEAEVLVGLGRIEVFRKNLENAEAFVRQAIKISQENEYRVEEASAWQTLGAAFITAGKCEEGEEAYARSLVVYEELDQEGKCTELRAELAWLAHQRGDQEGARKQIEFILPEQTADKLESIHQPSVCWCYYEVLKEERPDISFLLLERGHAELQKVLEQIAESQARHHYLSQFPHHAALVETWKSKNKGL